MIRVSWLYFVCALFYHPIESSAFMGYAYDQQFYLQGFQTESFFIVNLGPNRTRARHFERPGANSTGFGFKFVR